MSDARTVAALYYLAKTLEVRADDAALHDSAWEQVCEKGVDESLADDAYDRISESLRKEFQDQPERCLQALGLLVGRKKQDAVDSVQRFIRMVVE